MPTQCEEDVLESAVPALPVQIRSFQPGDEASFLRLNEEWIVRHFVMEDKDREVLGDPVRHILNPGGQIVIAVAGREVVGCCVLVPEGPGEYEVAKMAVTEALRGRGIGRRILQAVIDEAKKLGACRLYLETNSKLPSATYLYEALGFQHIPAERRKPSLYVRADVFMELLLR